jgi:hypothetical protein
MGVPGRGGAFEPSNKTAPTEPLRHLIRGGTEWLVGGGNKTCGFVETFNPSK